MENKEIPICIIGAGLTGLSIAYYLKKRGKKVLLLEKKKQAGGVIRTLTEDGFTFETGPNTGVLGTTELVELFRDLGDKVKVITANPHSESRWIWKNKRWNPLPSGPISAITTPLFSFKDKLNVLLEPFRKPGQNPDETVAELVVRRLGKSFLDYAIDPFIGGIYSGDPGRLVTRYALPKLYLLEQEYGSFIRGAIKKRKEVKSELEKQVTKAVFSIEGGLGELIRVLIEEIGEENILTEAGNLRIEKEKESFRIQFDHPTRGTEEIQAKRVVTTVDGKSLHSMLPFIETNDLKQIELTEYAKVIQVVLGYKQWDGIPLKAFGGLVPSVEKRDILGILFPSSLFKNRAPEGGALLSVFMGGINRPWFYDRSKGDLERTALKEVEQMLQVKSNPDLIKVYKYEKAIPQYELQSGVRLATIQKIESNYPGLTLAGNIRDGIGMADRVKQAKQLGTTLD